MIYSMTAFAREHNQGKSGMLVCEIRSINHRYLEISMYLPEVLRALEMPLRECVRDHVKRGKIECGIKYQSNPNSGGFSHISEYTVGAGIVSRQ